MDKRGLTTDPNRNFGATPEWWESLGPTQKPSPYAHASWKYLQSFKTEVIEIPGEVSLVYDNGTVFADYLYPIVWDGGLFNPVVPPAVILDSGGFNSSGGIVAFETTTSATVFVYDSLASYPNVNGLSSIVLDLGNLAIDPGEGVLQLLSTEDNVALETEDQDDMAIDPAGSLQLLATEDDLTFFFESTAQTQDDTPPGTMLGQLDYILIDKRVDVIGWSHYNWQDATPVKQAFKAMINSLPNCVEGVYVKDSPTAFWTDLGFRFVNKGDAELKFFPVRYRGY